MFFPEKNKTIPSHAGKKKKNGKRGDIHVHVASCTDLSSQYAICL